MQIHDEALKTYLILQSRVTDSTLGVRDGRIARKNVEYRPSDDTGDSAPALQRPDKDCPDSLSAKKLESHNV